jgi:lysophospholipase L1-like esterase
MRDWKVWPIVDKFLQFCDSADVPCIDLKPLFQEAVRQGGIPYLAQDTHWSSEGHELVAARLAEQLEYLSLAE